MLDEERRVLQVEGEVLEDGEGLEAYRVALLAAQEVWDDLHETASHDPRLGIGEECKVLQQGERELEQLVLRVEGRRGDLHPPVLVDHRPRRAVDRHVDEGEPCRLKEGNEPLPLVHWQLSVLPEGLPKDVAHWRQRAALDERGARGGRMLGAHGAQLLHRCLQGWQLHASQIADRSKHPSDHSVGGRPWRRVDDG